MSVDGTWARGRAKGPARRRWLAASLCIAAGAALAALAPGRAEAQPVRAGVAGAVVSPVEVSGPPRAQPVAAEAGMDMFLEDRIVTGADARLQVLLLDETVFTVGPNSDLVIDRFVYDPDTGTGEIAAEMTTGFLRYVSGKVGANDPDDVTIQTPAATIGIRGTALFVAKLPAPPDTYYCGVLGPGRNNNALAREGACLISNGQGTVEVRREGFGAAVTLGRAPETPQPTPPALVAELHRALRPATGPGTRAAAGPDAAQQTARQAGGQGMLDASGQPVAETRETTVTQANLLVSSYDQLTQREDIATLSRSTAISEEIGNIVDDVPGPAEIGVPFFAQLTWENLPDLDLHATAPNPGGEGRFHVFFGNPAGPEVAVTGPGGGTSRVPAIELGAVSSTLDRSEILTVNALTAGGPTRISVFNFSDSNEGSTSLAEQSEAMVSLLRNGIIQRGPGGSMVINGDLVDRIQVPGEGAGNTFVAYEIGPNGRIRPIGELTDFPNSIEVE